MRSDAFAHLELLRGKFLAVSFAYDAVFVAGMRKLLTSKWNARTKSWEVHLMELPELRKIFSLGEEDLPADVREAFDRDWAGSRLQVKLGNVDAHLAGGKIPLAAIDAATSFFLSGYKFSPKFKSGKWDGKRHLFNPRSMKFPAGLWPKIRSVLDEEGIEYKVEKPTRSRAKKLEFQAGQKQLRDYQAKVVEDGLRAGRGVVQLATGGGKTLIAAEIIRRIGRPTFFFVHTRELLHQTVGVFAEELGVEIGVLGDGILNIQPVTVATIQTASRVFDIPVEPDSTLEPGEERSAERKVDLQERRAEAAKALEKAGLIIFDECHHVPAETAMKLAAKLKGASFRFGLSATPWRDDARDMLLEAPLGPSIGSVRCSDLIERGYLVRPEIRLLSTGGPSFPARRTPYADVYRRAIVENQDRNRVIAAQAMDFASKGKSVLVLVAQVKHGEILRSMIEGARFSHGKLDMETRRRYLAELEQKLHLVLIGTTLADEGLDIPSLDAVILGGGGKSPTKAYQRIGRALRPAPGKDSAVIIDFLDRAPYLVEHSAARIELYRSEPAFDVQKGEHPS